MKRARLRVGVAGCGAVAQRVHLPLLQARPDVQLVAVADSNEDVLAETVARYGNLAPYNSVQDMLAEAELDAMVIALPTALHATAACSAFDAGLHVYIEKPLATTVDEATAVVHAWQRSGRIGMVGFNCRANPLQSRMRDLIRGGRAGSIVYMRTVFAVAPRSQPEWKQRRASGGGVLLDLGAHHVDLIRYLTGCEILKIHAHVYTHVTEDDTALLELQLSDGVGVHAFFSLASSELDHVEVHGDAARLSVARFTSLDVEVVDNPGRGPGSIGRLLQRATALRHLPRALAARRAPWREPGYGILLDRFVAAARTGLVPADAPGILDGFACTAAIAAAELSMMTGRIETPSTMPAMEEPHLQVTQ